MSWGSINATASCNEIAEALNSAAAEYVATNGTYLSAETIDAIGVAVRAAGALAADGSFGALPQVILSGHSNPGHKPLAGWSNDMVSVHISDTSTLEKAE